jgi:excisionase family DNA binding protein
MIPANVIDPILTVSEVAADLRCSKAHAYNVINGLVEGVSALPAIRIGRRRLVLRSTLERWKQSNETQTSPDDMLGPRRKLTP